VTAIFFCEHIISKNITGQNWSRKIFFSQTLLWFFYLYDEQLHLLRHLGLSHRRHAVCQNSLTPIISHISVEDGNAARVKTVFGARRQAEGEERAVPPRLHPEISLLTCFLFGVIMLVIVLRDLGPPISWGCWGKLLDLVFLPVPDSLQKSNYFSTQSWGESGSNSLSAKL